MRYFTLPTLRSRLATVLGLALVFSLVAPAAGQDISDLRRQREEARAAEQEALEQIDLLRADDEVIKATLDEIQALVDAQTARVDGSRQALAAAESEVLYRAQLASEAEAAVAEVTLLGQDFVVNPDLTVAKAAEEAGVEITGFVRMAVGEGIEVEKEDFAAEVAKAAQG